jgi:hypothetical protein
MLNKKIKASLPDGTDTVAVKSLSSPLGRLIAGLFLFLIALQAADALSTHLALATGKAQENNHLLLLISDAIFWPVIETVFVAKILSSGIFGVAILKTKASWPAAIVLALLAVYFLYVVGLNFFWAWRLS